MKMRCIDASGNAEGHLTNDFLVDAQPADEEQLYKRLQWAEQKIDQLEAGNRELKAHNRALLEGPLVQANLSLLKQYDEQRARADRLQAALGEIVKIRTAPGPYSST